jgi:hypothetical protein
MTQLRTFYSRINEMLVTIRFSVICFAVFYLKSVKNNRDRTWIYQELHMAKHSVVYWGENTD